ncbi:MAG: Holliday junction resolvase RuvX [Clostridia bacterium]|nr:Holliday junction resolvase RuvX [Clostridia bacterium]
MARILGIDYGRVRIGVAISDVSETIAGPLVTVKNRNGCLDEILQLCRDNDVQTIVMGYPRNMNGTEGENCHMVNEFADRLVQAGGFNIIRWDERLSSVAIHSMLAETGARVGKDKGKVDRMAAVYILQGYLDYAKNH